MINSIIATKLGMGQTFVEGRRVSITKVLAGPCVVTQIKSVDNDGYWAVQLGFGERRIKTISKPLQGHLKGVIKDLPAGEAGKMAPRFLLEVRLDSKPDLKVGDIVKASDVFEKGDIISVSGISKGKGFAGGVKRWGFHGGPRTHGQSDRERAPGSIGATTTPGRVLKGKHMAGRMGGEKVTIKNLQIVSVNPETNEIELSGPIPGIPGKPVLINKLSSGKLEGITEVQAQVVVEEEVPEEKKEEAGAQAPVKTEGGETNGQA
jgi:large subunit ribosomal protein L3